MSSPDDDIKDRPPGQQRPYPFPTKSGNISFTPSGTNLQCKTHYSIYGTLDNSNNAKPPLVCIHGGPGATSIYMRPFSLLNVDYGVPVIIYDQLGCGQSTHLRDKKGDTEFWTLDLFVAELRNLLEGLGIENVDILGHSWGGCVAVRFAAQLHDQHQHLNRVQLRKLTIAQSTAKLSSRTPYFEKQLENLSPPHGEAAKLAHQTGDTDTPAYKAALSAYSHHHMCRLSPWPAEFTDCMAAMREDDTVSSAFDGDEDPFDLLPDIKKLSGEVVPGGLLIFNGKYDQSMDEVVRPFWELPSLAEERKEWVRFGLSGHMAMLEETEEVMRVVGRFLMRE
jgi:proline-specific peptidase